MIERSHAEGPSVIARLFALQGVRPFQLLPPDELAIVAEVARPRDYAPGEMVAPGGLPLTHLLVVIAGRIQAPDGSPLGPIVGVASLLRDLSFPRLDAAAPSGARTLQISKRHFFTLARECPEFILGLLEIGEAGAYVEKP
ncbi:MAG TPA: hypothetical protein VGL42_01575 [Opitutaceae bacterium]|jgi:signal-transduction protein with cAMP-binding, CBS, and nucleotidyltransferase domain